ncbi:MAG: hypothetical protein Q4G27_01370 [Flavobacteriaceae bacterium]|nr:hypothetical protein [Flavobacteriaceae bacterium]
MLYAIYKASAAHKKSAYREFVPSRHSCKPLFVRTAEALYAAAITAASTHLNLQSKPENSINDKHLALNKKITFINYI